MNVSSSLAAFWSERAPRERRILVGGGVALALLVLYLALVDPAASGVARLQRGLPQARLRAAELDGLVSEAKSLRNARAEALPGAADARTALTRSLADAGLQPVRNDPVGNGDLRLAFANVSYAKWTSWLANAEQTIGVHAVSVHVKANGTPGNADIELGLRLPRT